MHDCEQIDRCWRSSLSDFPLVSFEKPTFLACLGLGWADVYSVQVSLFMQFPNFHQKNGQKVKE